MERINTAVRRTLDAYARDLWGRTLTDALRDHICICCGETVTTFKDRIAARNYQICGFCSECYDNLPDAED